VARNRDGPNRRAGVLLCDLDDTLLDNAATYRRWARGFAARQANRALLPWLLARREEVRDFGVTGDLAAAMREAFDVESTPDSIIADYERVASEYLRCPVPVRQALIAARRRRWRIAVVTNGGEAQWEKVRRAGIEHLLDACCVSELEGFAKPDPQLFEIAARRCEESTARAWIIGDSADTDIAPARVLGVPSIWLSDGRRWPPRHFVPTFITPTFAEAITIVSRPSG
jgi:putative hydrolase of the HAD superfamily